MQQLICFLAPSPPPTLFLSLPFQSNYVPTVSNHATAGLPPYSSGNQKRKEKRPVHKSRLACQSTSASSTGARAPFCLTTQSPIALHLSGPVAETVGVTSWWSFAGQVTAAPLYPVAGGSVESVHGAWVRVPEPHMHGFHGAATHGLVSSASRRLGKQASVTQQSRQASLLLTGMSRPVMSWAQLPLEAFPSWARFHGVAFDHVALRNVQGKGLGLVAQLEGPSAGGELQDARVTLLKIPRDLVLSADAVEQHAKVDQNFRRLLDATGHQVWRRLVPRRCGESSC